MVKGLNSLVHAGLRTRLSGTGWDDYALDDAQGFIRLTIEDIDEVGTPGVVDAIVQCVGRDASIYLSIDIDVLDLSTTPGTGAPEHGGWTMREMNHIMRGLGQLYIVGADILEVAPPFDNRSETTSLAAAQIAYEIMTLWVKRGL